MTAPTTAERPDYPSEIIMLDADGYLTDDPKLARSGEVIETQPDGTKIYTSFTA